MRVALLAAASAIHSTRWANGLAEAGHEVHLISAHAVGHRLDERVRLHLLPVKAPLGYLLSATALRSLLRTIRPDVLNAHYATGYGVLARLSGFSPYLLSVWGSDVYDFPRKSALHRRFLRSNLLAADAVGSTSHCMARVVRDIDPGATVHITSFGVDIERFRPSNRANGDRRRLVVGTVKTLASKYGIDVLIRAFALARIRLDDKLDLRLEIVGAGPQLAELEALARSLGVADAVVFLGKVAHEDVPAMLARFDIYAALSRLDSESFGVAALEASACGLPIVVSDAQGLAEVTVNGESGFVVAKEDAQAAAEALVALASSEGLRARMGAFGRAHVIHNYTWSGSLDQMHDAYQRTAAISKVQRV